MARGRPVGALLALVLFSASAPATADVPNGAALLRVLGARAESVLSPSKGHVSALVELPPGKTPGSLGLREAAPGFAWVDGRDKALAFAKAHPTIPLEVGSPLHLLNERVGQVVRSRIANASGADGAGTLVGVADTGADVTHPDFLDENGKVRVAWVLDLSRPPRGTHADLEAAFGVKDDAGVLVSGAVYSKADLQALVDQGKTAELPTDEVGHGSHVSGSAVGGGGGGPHAGVAPRAELVVARITRPGTDSIDNDDLVRAVGFMFAVADRMKRPMSVNLSLGSDFGPHDGSMMWERAIASFVGPSHPGRAIVAAAGNSGSVAEQAIHQSVHVPRGATVRVPITSKAVTSGAVQVWATFRGTTRIGLGVDSPLGEWVPPVAEGAEDGERGESVTVGVVNGSLEPRRLVPEGHRGAVAVWSGAFREGTYAITLENQGDSPGDVDLYLQALGGAAGLSPVAFTNGVREGTINLPAAHPSIIGVGCSVNRVRWRSAAGSDVALTVPETDALGLVGTGAARDLVDGEVCWFSSAGPNVDGVQKPEIAAPGGIVASTASRQAPPSSLRSIFTSAACPKRAKADPSCLLVDRDHGISAGTSMASPIVAGVVALLFQKDPTLTQDKVAALLQAGAHPFRGPAPFDDQNGPGEVDVLGSLDALERLRDPKLYLPSAARSWIALSSSYVPADGSRAVTALLELRTEDGEHRADLFDVARLVPTVRIAGVERQVGPVTRKAPGLYTYTFRVGDEGLGLERATFGATFDGVPIVAPRTIPVATDPWNAGYSSRVGGGCSERPLSRDTTGGAFVASALGLALATALRRRPRG